MDGIEQRQYWLNTMIRIGEPVLSALSARKLKEVMPVVYFADDRTPFAHLEAFGRLLCGMAPWFEAEGLEGEEAEIRMKYLKAALECIDAATDPGSPDYMNFDTGAQPLVDAAFLSHALVRAPKALTENLDRRVKNNVVSALKKTRKIIAGGGNWIFFSAMVETALYLLGVEDYDGMRVSYAISQFMQWYKGDGVYGDGPQFHWDYYNSFVIQPMLVDIINVFEDQSEEYKRIKTVVIQRARRYASILEKSISPEGTYPAYGRSITYRFGAFQMLSQAALQHILADDLKPAQVRCALTAVIKKSIEVPGTFDENGWLRHGLYGYQPGLAEHYISTGSLYLCAAVFLPLGLMPADEFWSGENTKWSSRRLLDGEDLIADHSI